MNSGHQTGVIHEQFSSNSGRPTGVVHEQGSSMNSGRQTVVVQQGSSMNSCRQTGVVHEQWSSNSGRLTVVVKQCSSKLTTHDLQLRKVISPSFELRFGCSWTSWIAHCVKFPVGPLDRVVSA